MTASRSGSREFMASQSPKTRADMGRIRRMAIGITTRVLWQLLGHVGLDGKRETRNAEVFGGAGMAARPGGRNAEAVVVFPGEGASSPIVVAVRDEEMRLAIVAALTGGTLGAGEIALGAGTEGTVEVVLHLKTDGTIEARSAGGAAASLALKSDVETLRSTFNAHTHVYSPGPGGPVPTEMPLPLASIPSTGTTVLLGE